MHSVNAPVGTNVVGYLDAPLGIGEVARNVSAALKAAGIAVAEVAVANDAGPARADARPPQHAYPVNIVCINPDGLTGAEAQLERSFFADRYTIGYWWWEVEAFPPRWERAFDLVDEIWTGSRFVADALAPAAPLTKKVVALERSRRKMSLSPLVSPATRLVASLSKRT